MYDLLYKLIFPLFSTLLICATIYYLNILTTHRNKSFLYFNLINYLIFFICDYLNTKEFSLVIIISLFIYIYLNTKNILYSFTMSLLSVIIIGVSDSLISIIFINVFEFKRDVIINEPKLFYTTQICIFILTIFVCKVISKVAEKLRSEHLLLHNIQKKKNIKVKNNILIESSFLMLVLFFYLLAFSRELYKDNYSSLLFYSLSFILLLFIFLSLLIILMRNIKTQIKHQYQDKEFQQLQEYTKSLEKMSINLKKVKQDYSSIISNVGEYINDDDILGLKNYYYNDLLSKMEPILEKNQSLSSLEYINETPLKSIISSKIIFAKVRDVKIHIDIANDMPSIPMRILEVCRITEIFLDNAIEASIQSREKYINITFINTESNIIFIIQNSCGNDVPPINKIYEENFSTKGEGRGLSLSTAMDIINKTRGRATLNTTYKDNIFTQELTIKKQKLM